jgi:hypothetical protein
MGKLSTRGKIIFIMLAVNLLSALFLILAGIRESKKIQLPFEKLHQDFLEKQFQLYPQSIRDNISILSQLQTQKQKQVLKFITEEMASHMESIMNHRLRDLHQLRDDQALLNRLSFKKFLQINNDFYSEIAFLNPQGKENFKVSEKISPKKNSIFDMSEKLNESILKLGPSDLFFGPLRGEYIPNPILGPYTKAQASQLQIPYRPEGHAYSMVENPLGKKFQGSWRVVAPIYTKGNKLKGFISLQVRQEFWQNFLESSWQKYFSQENLQQSFFLFQGPQGQTWAHPRHAYIVGLNSQTGQFVAPWIDQEWFDEYRKVPQYFGALENFIQKLPLYAQSQAQVWPSEQQLKLGEIPFDCRYARFAPQCLSWKNILDEGKIDQFDYESDNEDFISTVRPLFITDQLDSSQTRQLNWGQLILNVPRIKDFDSVIKIQLEKFWQQYLYKQDQNILRPIQEAQKKTIDRYWRTIYNLILWNVFIILFLMGVFYWFNKNQKWKMQFLIKGLGELKDGNIEYTWPDLGDDDLGVMALALNEHAQRLQEGPLKIQELISQIENKEITQEELISKLHSLKKF